MKLRFQSIFIFIIILLLTGCANTLYDSERLFFDAYSSHLAAFNILPEITKEYKIRVPEFELIVTPDEIKCKGKIVTGCLSKIVELKDGKVVWIYRIRLMGRMVAGKVYLNPDVLAHEIEHVLQYENAVFVDPHLKYKE